MSHQHKITHSCFCLRLFPAQHGIFLICHGFSDGRSIRNALQGAARLADRHINKLITEALAEVPV